MPDSSYIHRVRVRVNGLLVENDTLLLIRLYSPVRKQPVWMPPGGGLKFGETMESALEREIPEETGLTVETGPLRYIHELIEPPFHAVEFYFDCRKTGGKLQVGSDPERSEDQQIIEDAQFVPFSDLENLNLLPEYLKRHFEREFRKNADAVIVPKRIHSLPE